MERKLGFYLRGWVPVFIKKRIRGLQSSGIFEWWNELVAVHLVKLRESSKRFQQVKFINQNNYSNFRNKDMQKSRSIWLI